MRARTSIRWAVALLILAGLAILGVIGYRAARHAQGALADLNHLQQLAGQPSLDSLPALQQDLVSLETHLVGTRQDGSPFLWLAGHLGWVPGLGPNLEAAPLLLDMGIALAGGGRQTLEALAPVTALLTGEVEGGLLSQGVPALALAAPGLGAAEDQFAAAEALRAQVPSALHPRLASLLQKLDQVLPLAHTGLQVAQVAPELLGQNEERTYLILAQNSHELRATGGFISGAGIIRLRQGQISEIKITDSYAVDDFSKPHPLAPKALSEQMQADLWVLRDSNWSPHFPDSAEVARALYELDQGVPTDGVIAIDLEAVRLLVGALGPVTVPGMPEPATAANVIDIMKQAWASPATTDATVVDMGQSDWWSKRKDFMGQLMLAALAKLEAGQGLDPSALASAVLEMLDGRHVQIAIDDPLVSEVLAERGWDGALRPPAHSDFLAVVDSNVGFNKANAAIEEEIDYTVTRNGSSLEASLTLTYTHTAATGEEVCDRTPRYGESYDELVNRCYWDYVRIYAPDKSELLAADGLKAATTEPGEAGTTVFAGDFMMRPGEQHVVRVRYRLPAAVAQAPYRLAVRMQAGTPGWPLTVTAAECRWQARLLRDQSFSCAGEVGEGSE